MLNLLEPYDLKSMGPSSAEALAPVDRGEEARLRGPGQVLRRPRVRQGARRRADLEAVRRPTRASSSIPTAPTTGRRPASPAEADTIYLTVVDKDRNCVADPEQLPRLRLRPRPGRPRLRAPEPRLPLRPRPRPRQPPGAAQAAVPHDHPRLRHQGRQAVARASA